MAAEYYLKRDGTIYPVEKRDILSKIDNAKPETFIPYLVDMDYPYIQDQWERLISQYGIESQIFGRYLATMRLAAFKVFKFEDSGYLNQKLNITKAWDQPLPIKPSFEAVIDAAFKQFKETIMKELRKNYEEVESNNAVNN